jgi:hypothetical protein
MPESANEHLDYLRAHIRKTQPVSILDVGMGRGNYGWFLRQDIGWRGHLTGLEVWAPYVEGPNALAGGNRSYYNKIIVGDIRYESGRSALIPTLDTIFAFDVIEHMLKAEGVETMKILRLNCKELLVSVPIVIYPQGELHGNPYERHLHDWTIDEMVAEGGLLVGKGAATGLFLFTSLLEGLT